MFVSCVWHERLRRLALQGRVLGDSKADRTRWLRILDPPRLSLLDHIEHQKVRIARP